MPAWCVLFGIDSVLEPPFDGGRRGETVMGNAPSAVAQRVENGSKTGVCSLKELKLERLPEELLSVRSTLRSLDVSVNKLTVLPPSLGEFANLRTLNLSQNKLTQLPETLGDLKKLETLNLDRNCLPSLPESLVNIKSLKKVTLSHNKLSHFPLFLCQLTRLDFADLSSNSIDSLPESGIDIFNGVELNLNCNSISVLPAALAKCKRLKVLRVEENTLELGGLPDVILTESNISLLCLDGNLFSPRELQQLPQYDKYLERYTATKKKADQ